eukprot:1195359-Prorocentrum_minimum.AAC.3
MAVWSPTVDGVGVQLPFHRRPQPQPLHQRRDRGSLKPVVLQKAVLRCEPKPRVSLKTIERWVVEDNAGFVEENDGLLKTTRVLLNTCCRPTRCGSGMATPRAGLCRTVWR